MTCTATLTCEFLWDKKVPLVLACMEDKLSNIVDEFFAFHFLYDISEAVGLTIYLLVRENNKVSEGHFLCTFFLFFCKISLDIGI